MGFENIDTTKLSAEQKVILHLAKIGYLTAGGDIQRALRDQKYAEFLVTGNGLSDELPGCDDPDHEHCNHEAMTNEEIQEVFDNDYYDEKGEKL